MAAAATDTVGEHQMLRRRPLLLVPATVFCVNENHLENLISLRVNWLFHDVALGILITKLLLLLVLLFPLTCKASVISITRPPV